MNFPSVSRVESDSNEFEVTVEDVKDESTSPAKSTTREVLVLIPRGIRYKVDLESYPGMTCVRIPTGEPA